MASSGKVFIGRGYSWVAKTQSAKCFHWGRVFLGSQNSKCQVLATFSFSEVRGVFFGSQNSECQVLVKFSWGKGVLLGSQNWGGVFLGSQNSKCQVLAKFSLGEVCSWVGKVRIGILGKMSKDFAMPYSGNPYIADSHSHTMCVETNESLLRNENFKKPLDIFLS